MAFSKKIHHILKEGKILTQKAEIAHTPIDRMIGLLGKKSLQNNEALILSPCRSITTFFMRFPIDVAFINKEGTIVALYQKLKPYRLTWFYTQANDAIEWPAGIIEKWNLKVGETLNIEEAYV